MIDLVITLSTFLGALIAIGGVLFTAFKWFVAQNKQSADIKALKELHEKDMEETRKNEDNELQALKDELCLLSYAMLAALDGLKQLHCNGEVTKAHTKLEKHINQRAHNQV